jgi:hypothetical protein
VVVGGVACRGLPVGGNRSMSGAVAGAGSVAGSVGNGVARGVPWRPGAGRRGGLVGSMSAGVWSRLAWRSDGHLGWRSDVSGARGRSGEPVIAALCVVA